MIGFARPPSSCQPAWAGAGRWALALAGAFLILPAGAQAGAPPAPATTGPDIESLTWTELRDAVSAGSTTVLVPIGGTEQSGPHLVLGKHNARVHALADRIALRLGHALVAPVIAYVPEGSVNPASSHMRFAGTITVPDAVFEATLESAAESLRAHGLRLIVLLGDHGGYQRSLTRVADRLNRRWGRGPARVIAPPEYYRASTEGFARILREHGFADSEIGTHAALLDTSLQLALDPAGVRRELLGAPGARDPAQGVYGGSPARADAALGELGVELIVHDTVEAVRAAALGHPARTNAAATAIRPDGP